MVLCPLVGPGPYTAVDWSEGLPRHPSGARRRRSESTSELPRDGSASTTRHETTSPAMFSVRERVLKCPSNIYDGERSKGLLRRHPEIWNTLNPTSFTSTCAGMHVRVHTCTGRLHSKPLVGRELHQVAPRHESIAPSAGRCGGTSRPSWVRRRVHEARCQRRPIVRNSRWLFRCNRAVGGARPTLPA